MVLFMQLRIEYFELDLCFAATSVHVIDEIGIRNIALLFFGGLLFL